MRYGNEVFLVDKDNDFSIYNLENEFMLNAITSTNFKSYGAITYFYKNTQLKNNNFITIGCIDGSITIIDQDNPKKTATFTTLCSTTPTIITTWDNNTKWLIVHEKTCTLFGFESDQFPDALYINIILNESIVRAGFHNNNLLTETDNGKLMKIHPCPIVDTHTLENCTFFPQQASLIYRLIQCHNQKKKPNVPTDEQATFDGLSETFRQLLLNTEVGLFSYTPEG